MLKRVLVLLGETDSSACARTYAFRLARQTGAGLSGLAGVDLAAIESPMPGALGATAYKAHLEDELKAKAEQTAGRLQQAFEAECAKSEVACDRLVFEGDAEDSLTNAAETRDLIVTGHDTAFHGGARETVSEVISGLLSATPRPVVVCPERLPAGDGVIVAYDGSLPAMRALQLFALLGLERGSKVSVVAIEETEALAAKPAGRATDYLRAHGYRADPVPIATDRDAATVLAEEVETRRAGVLVMGAYGRTGLRELLFGSTTSELLEKPPCALFLYH
ncbi:hypothetical protein A33M_2779 [Rhodovulum sp. PH10]|uniref:universal stress protein n=1 Tax=Rhodovulum sp. PH10 TaxID=1187851 RepID=UPI00027C27B6|nr:universal stress protein [Rhodovulum sp. PH10]EJW11796.1 hypothetical protein A33M_2779 [Rhodovulum sp. PH10]